MRHASSNLAPTAHDVRVGDDVRYHSVKDGLPNLAPTAHDVRVGDDVRSLMINMDKNLVLVSGAVVFKEGRGKRRWFIVKQSDSEDWEIPKVFVRKGESSVRASIRMMGEQGGMTAQVLEEAGRSGGVTTINAKVLPQRHLYYLMILLSGAKEAIGFDKYMWLPYADAVRKLSSKRERMILKQARKVLGKWKKEQQTLNK